MNAKRLYLAVAACAAVKESIWWSALALVAGYSVIASSAATCKKPDFEGFWRSREVGRERFKSLGHTDL